MRRLVQCALAASVVGSGACDVAEVVLDAPDPLVVAEIYVEAGDGQRRATAFVHRTLGVEETTQVPGARVTLRFGDRDVTLTEMPDTSSCLIEASAELIDGTCYAALFLAADVGVPGQEVRASVRLPDETLLTGGTVIPGDFELIVPESGTERCRLPADTLLDLSWTKSEGAWAYIGETYIAGLAAVMEERNVEGELDEDPLFLTGLSVSAEDTTLVFPSEFGVFDRFSLDREIAVLLQPGLPEGTSAQVTIAASDRNSVNWIRGGNFNPSGAVRVPSLFGEGGSGVIGATVRRTFSVVTQSEDGVAACN